MLEIRQALLAATVSDVMDDIGKRAVGGMGMVELGPLSPGEPPIDFPLLPPWRPDPNIMDPEPVKRFRRELAKRSGEPSRVIVLPKGATVTPLPESAEATEPTATVDPLPCSPDWEPVAVVSSGGQFYWQCSCRKVPWREYFATPEAARGALLRHKYGIPEPGKPAQRAKRPARKRRTTIAVRRWTLPAALAAAGVLAFVDGAVFDMGWLGGVAGLLLGFACVIGVFELLS